MLINSYNLFEVFTLCVFGAVTLFAAMFQTITTMHANLLNGLFIILHFLVYQYIIDFCFFKYTITILPDINISNFLKFHVLVR